MEHNNELSNIYVSPNGELVNSLNDPIISIIAFGNIFGYLEIKFLCERIKD